MVNICRYLIIYMVLYIPDCLMDFWTIKQLPFQLENFQGFKKVSSSVGIKSQPRVYCRERVFTTDRKLPFEELNLESKDDHWTTQFPGLWSNNTCFSGFRNSRITRNIKRTPSPQQRSISWKEESSTMETPLVPRAGRWSLGMLGMFHERQVYHRNRLFT